MRGPASTSGIVSVGNNSNIKSNSGTKVDAEGVSTSSDMDVVGTTVFTKEEVPLVQMYGNIGIDVVQGQGSMACSGTQSEVGVRAGTVMGVGALVYETYVKIGFVLRSNSELGVGTECWRTLYLRDLQQFPFSEPFGCFLGKLFPQIRTALAALPNPGEVVVMYTACVQESGSGSLGGVGKGQTPPPPQSAAQYQTIGTLDEESAAIIGR